VEEVLRLRVIYRGPRLQANAMGGLSERARQRALDIANDADLRIRAPKNFLKQGLAASLKGG
jgi:hypothetical protein